MRFYACVNGRLQPTLLKPSLVFTFSLELRTQRSTSDSPNSAKNRVKIHSLAWNRTVKIHQHRRKIGRRFTSLFIALGEDSPLVFTYLPADFAKIHHPSIFNKCGFRVAVAIPGLRSVFPQVKNGFLATGNRDQNVPEFTRISRNL